MMTSIVRSGLTLMLVGLQSSSPTALMRRKICLYLPRIVDTLAGPDKDILDINRRTIAGLWLLTIDSGWPRLQHRNNFLRVSPQTIVVGELLEVDLHLCQLTLSISHVLHQQRQHP